MMVAMYDKKDISIQNKLKRKAEDFVNGLFWKEINYIEW